MVISRHFFSRNDTLKPLFSLHNFIRLFTCSHGHSNVIIQFIAQFPISCFLLKAEPVACGVHVNGFTLIFGGETAIILSVHPSNVTCVEKVKVNPMSSLFARFEIRCYFDCLRGCFHCCRVGFNSIGDVLHVCNFG